jgi:hypothetical protein
MPERRDVTYAESDEKRDPIKRLKNLSLGAAGSIVALLAVAFAGWVTHLIVAIQVLTSSTELAATVGYAVLLVLGIVIPPIGALHGIGIWFGLF